MQYDPDGLRVQLEDSAGTRKFIFDNQAYLLETDGGNVTVAVYTQEPTTYGNLISQSRFNGSIWVPAWYNADGLGNTLQVTDSGQNITDTWLYDAWGVLLARTGTTMTPFQWGGGWGYYTDPDTGIIYIRARIYIPWTGRWTTTDSLGFVDGMNLYFAYFVPNEVDPSGMDGHHWFPQREELKLKLQSVCGLLLGIVDIDQFIHEFTTPLEGWGRGTSHYFVEYRSPSGKYWKEVERIYNNSRDCCDLLTKMARAPFITFSV